MGRGTLRPPMNLDEFQLTSLFASFDAPEYHHAHKTASNNLERLETTLNKWRSLVKKRTSRKVRERCLESVLELFNDLMLELGVLTEFCSLHLAIDATHQVAKREYARLEPLNVRLGVARKVFTASLKPFALDALTTTPKTTAHRHFLSKLCTEAKHLLPDEMENLVSHLETSSLSAWIELQNDITSTATVKFQKRQVSLAELETLQFNPRDAIRQAAFRCEVALLTQYEVALAASLSGIRGYSLELCRRRGWSTNLEQALFFEGLTEPMLTTMHTACRAAFPLFKSYLRAKAKLLGKSRLAWSDRYVEVQTGKPKRYSFAQAQTLIVQAFSQFSQRMGQFAQRSFDEGWHHALPNVAGKTNTAFCCEIPGRKESRLVYAFTGDLPALRLMAHELGHAYHAYCLAEADKTVFQMESPSCLLETASIFCETLLLNYLADQAEAREKLAILNLDLHNMTSYVIEMTSRYLFETYVCEERSSGALTPDDFKRLMRRAQRETYGDTLGQHDLMWATRFHYYSDVGFYNFPYTFGRLFSLGLYHAYLQNPTGFAEKFDTFLALTGSKSIRELANDFSLNLETPDFWSNGLDLYKEPVRRFIKMARNAQRVQT
jgi:pepF/M3 family oligoendopeptidase